MLELTSQSPTKHFSVNTKQILSKPGKLRGVRYLVNVKIKSNYISKTNNQIETNPKTIPKTFNNFFFTIAKDIDNKILPLTKFIKTI